MNHEVLFDSERLFFRRLVADDAELFFRDHSLPDLIRFQSWKPRTIDEIRDFISKQHTIEIDTYGTWFQMAICLKNNGYFIGDCGFHFSDPEGYQVDIGYTIAPEFQGNGYAVESVHAMVQYLFTELHKHRLCGYVDPGNLASIRVLEKAGFRKEAHFRKSIMIDGQWCDDVVFAILKEEFVHKKGG